MEKNKQYCHYWNEIPAEALYCSISDISTATVLTT